MYNPIFRQEVSDPDLIKIGKININWAAADNFLGNCVNWAVPVNGNTARELLVYVIDTRKKLDILKKILKKKKFDEPIPQLITENIWVHSNWIEERNVVAHGYIIGGADNASLMSSKKQIKYDLKNLDRYLDHSSYACDVALRLNLAFTSSAAELAFSRSWKGRPT